ncbi:MAG: hypothetical protein JWL65_7319 [Gammaproteobacteria bacterium]|nr:hypothetical protein [Gammaproteobacteria bacterium]
MRLATSFIAIAPLRFRQLQLVSPRLNDQSWAGTPVETSLHKSFTSRKPRCDIGLKGSEPVMY